MENTRRFIVVLIVVLLMPGAAQSAEGPAKISNTRTASCLVKITSDPAVLPLSFETIDYLLHSSGVAGKAAREVLDLSPDEIGAFFTINYVGELAAGDSPLPSTPRVLPTIEGPVLGEGLSQSNPMTATEPALVPTPAAPGSPSVPRPVTSMSPPVVRPRSSRMYATEPTGHRIVAATPSAPLAEQTQLFSLNVQGLEAIKPAAEEFMSALVANLRSALANAFDEHSLRLKGQLQLAEEEARRAEEDLRQKQSQLREISGSQVLNRDSILAAIGNLRSNIQQIEMRQASEQVTIESTTKRIAELQAHMQSEIEKDSITDELKRLLELQQVNVNNVEKLSASGRVSASELADAQEKMARSRIELAQRREQLSKSKGGSQIESLTNTLTSRSEQIAQYKAQLAGYEQQLAQAEALLAKADDYELLSLKADIAKQGLQEALVWRDRLSRQIRMLQPPAVSVIGGQ